LDELKYLDELLKLNLPADDFAVFGSGPLAIRSLRENEDVDIIVRPGLWNELISVFPPVNEKLIKLNNIEIFRHWLPWFTDVNALIDTADLIDNIRFVTLENVLIWKKALKREKDLRDIFLLEDYLNT
jgi:hypothetical protein